MHAVNGIGDKMSSILAGEIDILDRRLVVETVSDDSNSLGYSCLRCIEALVSLTSIVLFNDTIILSRNSMSSDPFYMTTLSCVSAMSKFIQRCQEDKVVNRFMHALIRSSANTPLLWRQMSRETRQHFHGDVTIL